MSKGRRAALLIGVVMTLPWSVGAQTLTSVEATADAWWASEAGPARAAAKLDLLETEAPFEAVYAALAAGPRPSADPPTGVLELERRGEDGFRHRYLLLVPEAYDASRAYPLRFYLHGGVSRPDPGAGGGWVRGLDRLKSDDHIVVAPSSWAESPWWGRRQVENLRGILDEVRQSYHIDGNRVHAMGVSDGGTGVYYLAFRDPTPWASFLPFIGSPSVLLNPGIGPEGGIHPGNLKNRPLFIVNGEVDRLYPVRSMAPWLRAFEALDVEYEFRPQPGGHDLDWWPQEAENIERFTSEHVRDPHPDRVVWGTESKDRFPRAHWIVIDEVADTPGDEGRGALASWAAGLEASMVRATRDGNRVVVDAYRAARLRVLVSPEDFDLTRPIQIEVNGVVVFDGVVEPSLETLLEWAQIDRDPDMLYAAEIRIEGR